MKTPPAARGAVTPAGRQPCPAPGVLVPADDGEDGRRGRGHGLGTHGSDDPPRPRWESPDPRRPDQDLGHKERSQLDTTHGILGLVGRRPDVEEPRARGPNDGPLDTPVEKVHARTRRPSLCANRHPTSVPGVPRSTVYLLPVLVLPGPFPETPTPPFPQDSTVPTPTPLM